MELRRDASKKLKALKQKFVAKASKDDLFNFVARVILSPETVAKIDADVEFIVAAYGQGWQRTLAVAINGNEMTANERKATYKQIVEAKRGVAA